MAKPREQNNHSQVPLYAWISLVAFLSCLALLLLLVLNAEKLTSFSLVERIYYLVLVVMGLAAAVFLFGVLPSTAAYEGQLLGGKLRLGGAIVGAALVVVGGYFFAPSSPTFPLTVYVHGQGGPHDIVLRNSGNVVLELGPETKKAQIGENGEAYFPAIPVNFRGQPVPAWIEADTYESVDPKMNHRLDGSVLHLEIKRKMSQYQLAGTISDEAGNPLSGVRVALPAYHLDNETNQDGRFELRVIATSQQIVDLTAQKAGYQTKHLSPTLGDTTLIFSLQRSR
jgi:hypothetical protein